MSQFAFRLQTVVQLRKRERDRAAQAHEQAMRARQTLEAQIEQLLRERAAQQPLQTKSSNGTVDAQKLLESQRYQMHLVQQADELKSKRQLLDEECEKRRGILVEREKSVRAIEKLRERQLSEWQAGAAHREQHALDEWAGFQYWASNQDNGSS